MMDPTFVLMLRLVRELGPLDPEKLVEVMGVHGVPHADAKKALMRAIDHGTLGISIDWRVTKGDGKSLWP